MEKPVSQSEPAATRSFHRQPRRDRRCVASARRKSYRFSRNRPLATVQFGSRVGGMRRLYRVRSQKPSPEVNALEDASPHFRTATASRGSEAATEKVRRKRRRD